METAAPQVQGVIHRSPYLYGIECSTWTLKTIRSVISWLNGHDGKKPISLPSVGRIIKRLGARLKRGRAWIHSPDLAYDKKMAVIHHAQVMSVLDPKRFPLVYEDEVTYYRRAQVGKTWGSLGSRGARKANQGAGTAIASRIAACVDVHTGAVISRQRSMFPVKDMYRFFWFIQKQYPEAEKIFVVVDNWAVHFHAYVQEHLAKSAPKIVLLPLPTYAPWENPIEKLWLLLKKEVLMHHPWGKDWRQLKEHVKGWLEKYRRGCQALLHTFGINTKMAHAREIAARLIQEGKDQQFLTEAFFLPP